jgi:hypothetical protein
VSNSEGKIFYNPDSLILQTENRDMEQGKNGFVVEMEFKTLKI